MISVSMEIFSYREIFRRLQLTHKIFIIVERDLRRAIQRSIQIDKEKSVRRT